MLSGNVQAQTTRPPIRIGVHKAAIFTPALLLQKYVPADWKIELLYFTVPADMASVIVAGSLDAGYTGVTIAALARAKGLPIAIVSNAAEKGSAIVVRSDAAIRSVADLKGRKIGITTGGIQDILLREELRKIGMTLKDLQAIQMTSPDMGPALQRGDIEAFSGNEPLSSQTVRDGYGRILIYPYDNAIGGINGAILTSEAAIQSKAEMLRVIVAAHRRAVEELNGDLDAWASLTSKNWGYDLATTRGSLSNVALRWQLDDKFMLQYQAFMERLKEIGFLNQVPDPAKFVHREFMQN
jgi:NitT/TauT family transport system substrate-binding protein